MTLPAFVLGFLISTLPGAFFHLWRGGNAGHLFLYLVLGWSGFWVGHFAAQLLGWEFASLGPLRLGMALAGSLVFLGVGYWLSLVDEPQEN